MMLELELAVASSYRVKKHYHNGQHNAGPQTPTNMYFQNYTGRQKTFTSGPQRHVYATQRSRIVQTRVGRD